MEKPFPLNGLAAGTLPINVSVLNVNQAKTAFCLISFFPLRSIQGEEFHGNGFAEGIKCDLRKGLHMTYGSHISHAPS